MSDICKCYGENQGQGGSISAWCIAGASTNTLNIRSCDCDRECTGLPLIHTCWSQAP